MDHNINPGPIIPDLLVCQPSHRSESVWNNPDFSSKLNCCHYDIAAFRNDINDPRVTQYLNRAGFYRVSQIGHIPLDHSLISALVERWRPEIHAFHFPFGEVGITLQDVEVLLGLKIDGLALCGQLEKSKEHRLQQCFDFLGFYPDQRYVSPAIIKKKALEDLGPIGELNLQSPDYVVQQYTRRIIMQFLGGFLFPDTTRNSIRLCFLDVLQDLHHAGEYSWGGAVLSFLYRSLCRATRVDSSSIGGCLVLLQLWAWERLPMVRPEGLRIGIDADDRPYGAR